MRDVPKSLKNTLPTILCKSGMVVIGSTIEIDSSQGGWEDSGVVESGGSNYPSNIKWEGLSIRSRVGMKSQWFDPQKSLKATE